MLGWLLLLLLLATSSWAVHAAPASPNSTRLACGALGASIAAPGCPCTIPGGAQAGPLHTPCLAGYRCSSSVLGMLAATSPLYAQVPTQTPQGDTVGVCTPCTLGEFCPPGTVEETEESISLCRTAPFTFARLRNITDFTGSPTELVALCRGYRACPRGTTCPDPATSLPCPKGSFCPEGNSALATCNISRTLQWQPYAVVQPPPQFLMAQLVGALQPAEGNVCPGNSTQLTASCPAGWFCPTEARKVICPVGFYCPGSAMKPIPCPWLSTCNSEGNALPGYAWWGVLLILALLVLMAGALEVARRRGAAAQQRRVAEADVQQLIGTLGFKLVATEGQMGVCRLTGRAQQQQVGTLERWRNALFHGHATAALGGPAPPAPAGDSTAAARVGTWVQTGTYHPTSGLRHTSSSSSGGGGNLQDPGSGPAGAAPAGAVSPVGGEAGVTASAPGDPLGDNNVVCRKVCEDTPSGRVCTLECVVESDAEGHLGQSPGQSPGQPAAGGRGSTPGSSHTGVTQTPAPFPQNLGEGVESMAVGSAGGPQQQQERDQQQGDQQAMMLVPLSCRVELGTPPPTKPAGTSSSSGDLVKGPVKGLVKGSTPPAHYAPLGPHNLEQGSNKAAPIYPRLSLVFKDFTLLRGRCGTRIVSDVTGRYVHSKLHAVMGPSGCGKTSFCVALAGKVLPSRLRGEVSVIRVDAPATPPPAGATALTIHPGTTHTKEHQGTSAAAGAGGVSAGGGGGVLEQGKKGGHPGDTRYSDVTLLRDSESTGVAGSLLGVGPAHHGELVHSSSEQQLKQQGTTGGANTATTATTATSAAAGAAGPDASAMQALLKLKYTVGRNKEVLLLDDNPAEGVAVRVEDVRYITGFVPQDDLLHDTLTVAENLCYAAKLLMPPGTSAAAHVAAVREVLSLMGLAGVAQQQVGSAEKRGISGGQRKRANIGVELVHTPSLLFLDEPTSGLDAAVAQDVMGALSNYSRRGMNVVCVIHQPRQSIFEMFDSVTLLAKGQTVYHGPQFLTVPYLAFLGFPMPRGESTADFLLDVVAGAVPRPRDPEFVPAELPQVWGRCGDTWVEQQLEALLEAPTMCIRQLLGQATTLCPTKLNALLGACTQHTLQQQQQQQPGGNVGAAMRGLCRVFSSAGYSPHTKWEQQQAEVQAQLLEAAAEVDWPWRPRQLEALQERFKLIVDPEEARNRAQAGSFFGRLWHRVTSGTAGSAAVVKAAAAGGTTGAVLTYEGFLSFWSGLKGLMPPDEYSNFIGAICQDFGIRPGVSVTRRHFMKVLQHHMRAAAAWSAAAAAAADGADPSADPYHPEPGAAAAGAGGGGGAYGGDTAAAAQAERYYGSAGFMGAGAGEGEGEAGVRGGGSATAQAAAALAGSSEAGGLGSSFSWSHPNPLQQQHQQQHGMGGAGGGGGTHSPAAGAAAGAGGAPGDAWPSDSAAAAAGGDGGAGGGGGEPGAKVCCGRTCPEQRLVDIAARTLSRPLQTSDLLGVTEPPEIPDLDVGKQDQISAAAAAAGANSKVQQQQQQEGATPGFAVQEELDRGLSAELAPIVTKPPVPSAATPTHPTTIERSGAAAAAVAASAAQGGSGAGGVGGSGAAGGGDSPTNSSSTAPAGPWGSTPPATPPAAAAEDAASSLYEGLDNLTPSESGEGPPAAGGGAAKCTKPNISCALHFIREEAEEVLQERATEVVLAHQHQQAARSNGSGSSGGSKLRMPSGAPTTSSGSRSQGVSRSAYARNSTASHGSYSDDGGSDIQGVTTGTSGTGTGVSKPSGGGPGSSVSSGSGSRRTGRSNGTGSTAVAEVKVKRPTLLTDLEAFVPEHWDQRRLRKGGSEGPPGGKDLPGTWSQMWTIFGRSSRKWLNAREVVLADVLLTALLGCILSVAQQQAGGTPSGSLLWLVITVMAFGCLTLMRSLRSFGGERVIFLQRESRGGVRVAPYVLGRFAWDLITMTLQSAVFLGFLYSPVPPIPSTHYFALLLAIAWYTTGLGYLVSMWFSSQNALLAGIAVGLLLGGVANGVQPPQHTLPPYNPLWILDWLSFTRYAVEALYISWLVPTTTALAPRTATFMAGMGFCTLDQVLTPSALNAMDSSSGSMTTLAELFDSQTSQTSQSGSQQLIQLSSQQRMAQVSQDVLARNAAGDNDPAVAAAAQLFLFYSEPGRLTDMCQPHLVKDVLVLLLLGGVCRVLLLAIIKVKVLWKSQA